MKKLEKDQAVVISAYTGVLICKFSDMHEEIEKRIGRPVMTHELASDSVNSKIKELFKADFISLAPEGVK